MAQQTALHLYGGPGQPFTFTAKAPATPDTQGHVNISDAALYDLAITDSALYGVTTTDDAVTDLAISDATLYNLTITDTALYGLTITDTGDPDG